MLLFLIFYPCFSVISKDYKGDKYNVYTQDAWVMRGNTAVFTCDIRPSFVRPYVSVASWYIGDHQVMNGKPTLYC